MSATPTAADRARAWLIELGDDPDSGFAPCGDEPQESDVESLAKVIAEAVAHERERAARVCEATRDGLAGCNDCAAAIRAGESA